MQLNFKTEDACAEHELAVADLSLKRANQWVDGRNPNPPRPYTRLFSYRPHLKGNRGNWFYFTLQLEHDDGHIYGIAEITRPAGLAARRVTALKVIDYGTSLDDAIVGMQQVADETMQHFFETDTGKKARYAKYPFKVESAGTQVMDQADDVFAASYELIRERLAAGVEAAEQQQADAREREARQQERLQRLEERGYVAN